MARGSKKAIAMECLKDPVTRAYLLKGIGVLVRNELKAMCMDSTSSISKYIVPRPQGFHLGHTPWAIIRFPITVTNNNRSDYQVYDPVYRFQFSGTRVLTLVTGVVWSHSFVT